MVATAIITPSRFQSGSALSSLPKQTSLRSVTSTHSRNSLVKTESCDFSDKSQCNPPRRRVHFSCCVDVDEFESDSATTHIVHEYIQGEPVEPLYLTTNEIQSIRSDARKQSLLLAKIYPNLAKEIQNIFENGGSSLKHSNQIKSLRRRRPRCDPYADALESNDRDDDIFFDDSTKTVMNFYGEEPLCDDEDMLDDKYYFCTMRGLETRISPSFRIHRRMQINNVLDLQTKMKESGCCSIQIQMGLRAVSAQLSQKSRAFALYQASLDEVEIRGTH
jgi:hypothetical protein